MQSMQDDIQKKSSFSLDQSSSFQADLLGRGMLNVAEDYRTKALKQALASELQTTLLAGRLQCKPIEGHDMPLGELQKQLLL